MNPLFLILALLLTASSANEFAHGAYASGVVAALIALGASVAAFMDPKKRETPSEHLKRCGSPCPHTRLGPRGEVLWRDDAR